MERREQFFAETRRDPYAHMIARMYAEAWADGYDQALRDAARELAPGPRETVDAMRLSKTFSDRMDDAIERATKRKAEAEMMIALAQTGSMLAQRGLDGDDYP